MEEIFFPKLGMDFSELRQIALTFCHSFVNRLHPLFRTHCGPLGRPVVTRFVVVLRMQQIAIFASGSGSNAAKIIGHFRNHPFIKVSLVVCNKHGAGVLDIAKREEIPSLIIEKELFFGGDAYTGELRRRGIDFIVLAGFLWKIPPALIRAYPGRIVNIHPALLPKYGGKGMYGRYVHEAVIAAGEKLTGITIHYVDELYDHGQVLFQVTVAVEAADTAATVAEKVLQLEHRHFPEVIEKVVEALDGEDRNGTGPGDASDLQNHR